MNGTGGPQEERIRARDVNPLFLDGEPGSQGVAQRSVDGDLLAKWMLEDGRVGELVRGMEVEGDVWGVFVEFARGVGVSGDGEEEEVVKGVRRWFGEVLRPVL